MVTDFLNMKQKAHIKGRTREAHRGAELTFANKKKELKPPYGDLSSFVLIFSLRIFLPFLSSLAKEFFGGNSEKV